MVHEEERKPITRHLPIQRRKMLGVVMEMVQEGLEDGEEIGDNIPDREEFINMILLPFTPAGSDVIPNIWDFSQLITEVLEN
jgi:hypothetical protein